VSGCAFTLTSRLLETKSHRKALSFSVVILGNIYIYIYIYIGLHTCIYVYIFSKLKFLIDGALTSFLGIDRCRTVAEISQFFAFSSEM